MVLLSQPPSARIRGEGEHRSPDSFVQYARVWMRVDIHAEATNQPWVSPFRCSISPLNLELTGCLLSTEITGLHYTVAGCMQASTPL